jgi:hypothetical protein
MKTSLKLSLLANVLLAGLAFWLARQPRVRGGQPPVPASEDITGFSPTIVSAPARAKESDRAEATSFKWSQIECPNYPTYIANLRRIGCPEQTIREIIVADVDDLYQAFREELRQKTMARVATGAGFGGQQLLEAGLQQLRNEETGVIQALLGSQPQPASPQIAADSAADASAQAVPESPRAVAEQRELAKPASMPLVFQTVDPQALKLNEHQLQIIEELRQNFQQEIGGANHDPNDPAYLKRWQAAQRNADEMMAAMLGRQFQLDYEMQAEQAQAQNQ